MKKIYSFMFVWVFFFKDSVISQSSSLLYTITQTGGNSVFDGDCFQRRISPFGALVSIRGSRTVCVGLNQNKLNKHVPQCNNVAY